MSKLIPRREFEAVRTRTAHTVAQALNLAGLNFSNVVERQGVSDVLETVGPLSEGYLKEYLLPAVVSEGLALSLKAMRGWGSASAVLDFGCPSWSRFDYYHSALLGARSICAMLGVGMWSRDGNTWLIDALPQAADVKRAGAELEETWMYPALLKRISNSKQADYWGLFLRVCRVYGRDKLSHLFGQLAGIDFKSASANRHAIVYNASGWAWPDDLRSKFLPDNLKTDSFKEVLRQAPDFPDELDAMGLAHLVMRLLVDLRIALGSSDSDNEWIASVNCLGRPDGFLYSVSPLAEI